MKTIINYRAEAEQLIAQGFSSKAQQKEAIGKLSRAYDFLTEEHRDKVRKTVWGKLPADSQHMARVELFEQYELPMSLHHYRAKHEAAATFSGTADQIAELVDLRATAKQSPVVAPEPSLAAKTKNAELGIRELISKRMAQYETALEIGHKFGGLPVSVSQRHCVNQHGTQYTQLFFYLGGKLTPLGIIIAAQDELDSTAE